MRHGFIRAIEVACALAALAALWFWLFRLDPSTRWVVAKVDVGNYVFVVLDLDHALALHVFEGEAGTLKWRGESRHDVLGFGYVRWSYAGTADTSHIWIVPYWFLILAPGLVAGRGLRRFAVKRRGRYRHKNGLCIACGYDLRGGSGNGRCPECGLPIT